MSSIKTFLCLFLTAAILINVDADDLDQFCSNDDEAEIIDALMGDMTKLVIVGIVNDITKTSSSGISQAEVQVLCLYKGDSKEIPLNRLITLDLGLDACSNDLTTSKSTEPILFFLNQQNNESLKIVAKGIQKFSSQVLDIIQGKCDSKFSKLDKEFPDTCTTCSTACKSFARSEECEPELIVTTTGTIATEPNQLNEVKNEESKENKPDDSKQPSDDVAVAYSRGQNSNLASHLHVCVEMQLLMITLLLTVIQRSYMHFV